LIQARCPHRGAGFEYGRVRPEGIECCYHGWYFDRGGRCLAMPAEPPDSAFREKVRAAAYPVREMGGLLWAYLGPGESPILPRLDVVAREDGVRAVENFGLWPVNYMQILENSPDNTHTAILHGGTGGERADIWGREIPDCTWTEDEYGILCRAKRQNYDRVSHILMPTTNRLPQPWPGGQFKWPRHSAIFRTPVDDTHTLVLSAVFTPFKDGQRPALPPGHTFDITEQLHVHRLQDYQAVASQGPIYDRTDEHLGASDRGVILLRKLVFEGIAIVERGEDPKGVRRGPETEEILDCSREVVDDLMAV
jgi:5,5'-dehydrodivanillate O-demethylase